MALRFADNFKFWTSTPGVFTTSSGVSISSGRLVATAFIASYGEIQLSSQGTWIINMRLKYKPGSESVNALVTLRDGSTTQCCLALKSSGKLAIFRGASNGTQIGSDSINAILRDDSTYYDIEVKFVLGNTGSVVVKVNGVEEINAASVDNTSTASNTADNVRLGTDANAGGSGPTYEHVVVMDGMGSELNDFIGPVNVNAHFSTADGNYTTWAANTGNRWAAVDDAAPNSDTDYVSAGSVGDKVSFVVQDTPSGTSSVLGVAVWVNAKRDDAATRAFKVLLRSGGSDQLGSVEHFVGPSYAYFFTPFNVSPFTSVAFTPSEVNGLEVGLQVTT